MGTDDILGLLAQGKGKQMLRSVMLCCWKEFYEGPPGLATEAKVLSSFYLTSIPLLKGAL